MGGLGPGKPILWTRVAHRASGALNPQITSAKLPLVLGVQLLGGLGVRSIGSRTGPRHHARMTVSTATSLLSAQRDRPEP